MFTPMLEGRAHRADGTPYTKRSRDAQLRINRRKNKAARAMRAKQRSRA